MGREERFVCAKSEAEIEREKERARDKDREDEIATEKTREQKRGR
jgi:hypothetical protein